MCVVALATWVRWLLNPVLEQRVPFATYFVAVVFAAWHGGFGPGILSVVLGTLAATWLFIPPENEIIIRNLEDGVSLGLFLFLGGATALISGAMHSAQRRARQLAGDRLRDITEQQQSEQALRESEDRLRLALLAGEMGTWDWNIQTGAVVWSPGLELIHGLPPGSFRGTFEAFQHDMHPDDREHVLASIRATVDSGREHRVEYRIIRPDGDMRWVEGRGRLFRDAAGAPSRMIGVCTDTTARKRAEQATRFLADASASLTSLIDPRSTLQRITRLAVPDFADWCAVDMVEADGELRRVAVAHLDPVRDHPAQQLFARAPSPGETGYGPHHVLQTRRAESMAEIPRERIDDVARGEEHRPLPDQSRPRSYICVPLLLRNEVLGVLTFVSAASGRRYGPEDVAVAEDLARRATVAIENARLYHELRAADRHKDEFLAMLGHELRNPLAPLRTGLDVLDLNNGKPAPPEVVSLMKRQVEHLVRLVDDLLDVSRIMRGKVELRREPVALSSVVERAVETVRASIAGREQQLSVRLPDDSVWLDADEVRLTQVLDNLLSNASKYTDPGGRIELQAAVDEAAHTVRVCVSDDGIGIEPDLLPRIFDLFTQSARASDRSQGGLGIGLTLVKNLVEMHGGAVWAESPGLGGGSRFTVQLPTCESPVQACADPETPAESAGRRVLVVDDNVGATRMLSVLIEKLGPHEIAVAHDGTSALETAGRFHPDLVLLDIGLPGMDGFEVAGHLRAREDFQNTLLVALTGYGQDKDRRRSMQAGFDEHVVKPPSVDLLQRLLSHPKLESAERSS